MLLTNKSIEMEYSGRYAYAISIVVLVHISASLSLFHHHANATRCVDMEREALLAIKQDLVDEGDLLSSWGSGSEAQKQDCCRWERVYCDNQTGHVLRLDLRANDLWKDDEFTFSGLRGKISPKLIELHHLTYLDLSGNDFNGSQIPPFIGSLTNLRYLDLFYARFGGQIPYQLGNLTHLQHLDLGFNFLFHYVENLNWLPHLSSLKYLDLSRTNLSNVFDWLETVTKLPNLRNLSLSDCDLPSPILSTLSHINSSQSLAFVDLSYSNVTSSIFKWLCNYNTTLVHLDLSSARLGGQIPFHALGNLTNLQYLNLGNLPYSVENLNWLPHLSSLKYLDLSDTNLSNVFDLLETVNKLPNLRNLTLYGCGLPPQILSSSLSYINSSKSLASVVLGYNNVTSSIFKWLCNYNTTLVYLDLSLNKLSGSLPNVFGNMSSLAHLSLSENQLEGGIPDSFAKLCGLQYLDISWNKLKGEISDSFAKLCGLQYLDISYNNFKGEIPDSSAKLSGLQHLDISWNNLKGEIPDSFAKLCGLQYLGISSNNLSGHISNFFESSCAQNSLETLDVSGNHLVGSFPNLTKFLVLKRLDLDENQLSGTIPESIGQLSNLEEIGVGYNHLEGVISETHFSQLSKLQCLDLSSNSLVLDFHSEWVPPFQLDSLYLASCKMGPLFPKWLRTQKNLEFLLMSNAGISDIIPSWFWSRNTVKMDLSRNEIKGKILANSGFEFADAPGLDLSWNQLEGPIPSFFSKASSLDLSNNKLSKVYSFFCSTNVSNLNFLNLSSNQVSGELPDCWKHFEHLVFLDLSNNKFSRNIPTTVGSLSSIETLKLDNNKFAGELPSSLQNCSNLRAVDLESNELSGPIPKWLGVEVSKLAILILRSNHFNGSMPSQLCNLRSIQVLDLSMNNISGGIPKCLNNLTTLAQKGNPDLTISHNYTSENGSTSRFEDIYDDQVSIMWKGIFAKYKSTLGLVKIIDLSSNRLTGEIPSAITDLVGLVSLNLSRNHLTEQIPLEIGKLKSLDSLDLSRNQIDGRIPTSLAHIDGLGYLDLSYNNLSDEIPTGTQLQGRDPSFYAGNSQLCGLPLKKICDPKGTGRPNVSTNQKDPDELITQGFYINLGLGFVVGFWGVCGSLIFKRSWRYAYYKFLNTSNDWLYVMVALIIRKLKDVLNR